MGNQPPPRVRGFVLAIAIGSNDPSLGRGRGIEVVVSRIRLIRPFHEDFGQRIARDVKPSAHRLSHERRDFTHLVRVKPHASTFDVAVDLLFARCTGNDTGNFLK